MFIIPGVFVMIWLKVILISLIDDAINAAIIWGLLPLVLSIFYAVPPEVTFVQAAAIYYIFRILTGHLIKVQAKE